MRAIRPAPYSFRFNVVAWLVWMTTFDEGTSERKLLLGPKMTVTHDGVSRGMGTMLLDWAGLSLGLCRS